MSQREPYESLLESAHAAHTASEHKVAVILAQTALEVYTEKALGQLYRRRNIEYLKPEFEHLLINYNLANSKVSSLYQALSGDQLTAAPFGSAIQTHIQLRNDLVHEGRDATAEDAEASLGAVEALIAHVETQLAA